MRTSIIVSVFLAVFVLASCSGSGIITPDVVDNGSLANPSPLYISDWDSNGNPNQGMGILGVFQGHIDVQNMTAELTPIRNLSTTDVIEVVDITGFLTVSPCSDCVKLSGISTTGDNYLALKLGIKHPFAAGDPLKPTTGKNRADLQVFNVEGIVAISSNSSTEFPAIGVTSADIALANADGYTAYLDEYLDDIMATDADIHPYILHFADYSQGNFDPACETGFTSFKDPIPNGNLVMPMGSDFDYRDYVFKMLPGDQIDFIYAVGCTYAITTSNKSERFTPDYRIPQDNKKAASEVWVEVAENNLAPGNASSDADLVINVLDINHGVAVGTARNEMAHDSSVNGISVEIPEVTLGAVTSYAVIGGDGRDPMNPLQFGMTVANSNAAGVGTYTGIVKVLDSYPPGSNLASSLQQKDGIFRVGPYDNPLDGLFAINEFATYSVFEISIGTGNLENPIAVIATTPSPAEVDSYHATVSFDGSGSYDPDGGSITLFEWDFDWDGVDANFSPDVSGINSTVAHNYGCMTGVFNAGLRVTDDDTPAGVSAIESVTVTITEGTSAGAWEDHELLGTDYIWGDGPYMTGQSILVNSSGLVYIITSQGTLGIYRTFDGTNMTPPTPIAGIGSNNSLTASIDSDDEIHVGWRNYTLNSVYHTQTDGGVFTGTVDTLHTAAATYTDDRVCINSNGTGQTMLTWLSRVFDTAEDTDWYYVVYDSMGHSAAQIIPYEFHLRTSPSGGSMRTPCPNLIVSPIDQTFHLIHIGHIADLDENPVLLKIDWNGTEWNNRDMIYDPAGQIFWDFSAIYDNDGDIHIHGGNGATVQYLRYDASTAMWQDVIDVSNSVNAVPNCASEIDQFGNVYITWVDNPNTLRLKVYCKNSDEAAILSLPSIQIDADTTSNDQHHIDIAWGNDGSLLAVYQDKLQSGSLYFNRFVD